MRRRTAGSIFSPLSDLNKPITARVVRVSEPKSIDKHGVLPRIWRNRRQTPPIRILQGEPLTEGMRCRLQQSASRRSRHGCAELYLGIWLDFRTFVCVLCHNRN